MQPPSPFHEYDDLNETWRADADAARLANDELHEKLDELMAARATDIEATKAAQAQATHAAAETARIEHALRSELETLASLQAEAEPDESVNELKQTIQALAETTDERIATLATELRAETATRTDEIRRVDELERTVDAIAEELKTQTESVERARTADAKAAKTANGQLSERLDELVALRATDAEAIQAARAEAAPPPPKPSGSNRLYAPSSTHWPRARPRPSRLSASRSSRRRSTHSPKRWTIGWRPSLQSSEPRPPPAPRTPFRKSWRSPTSSPLRSTRSAKQPPANKQRLGRSATGWPTSPVRWLHESTSSLVGRADDVEAAQVAQERAAAEISRVEQGLMASLAELAVQVADLEDRLARQSAARDSESLPPDDEPSTPISDARDPQIKKRSKRDKGKKKPKH